MDYGRLRGRLAPDVFERLRRHRGIAYRVRDAGVAKEVLQMRRMSIPFTARARSRSNAAPCGRDSGTPASHFPGTLDQAGDAHAAERLTALVLGTHSQLSHLAHGVKVTSIKRITAADLSVARTYARGSNWTLSAFSLLSPQH
jgi:hypothetical protein